MSIQAFFNPVYIFAIVMVIFLIAYLQSNRKYWRKSTQERLWRKFAFAHQELFPMMGPSEKEELKQTYINTLRNSATVNIKYSPRKSQSKKSVSFTLEKNVTHNIPYHSKFD